MAKTAEQRIEKSHLGIMKHPNFCAWAGLLFLGGWKVDDKTPTACVNAAGHIWYGRQFIDGLKSHGGVDAEVNFVVLHENGHKALLHMSRHKDFWKKCAPIANIAADHVVNNMILESDPDEKFARMPRTPDGKLAHFRDPKYVGKSFKEVFVDLMKNVQIVDVSGGYGDGGDGDGGGGGYGDGSGATVLDAHDLSGGDGTGENAAGDADQGAANGLTPEQESAMEKMVEDALRSGSYLAGKQGGNANRLVGDILEPKIDWREQMRDFATDSFQGDDEETWKRPNRRFIGFDMYLPSHVHESVGKLAACIDVSGSVGDAEMNACISEVMELCRLVRPAGLTLIYWDSGIRKIEEYAPEQYDSINTLTKPVGGGGTEVEPVAEWLSKQPGYQCAIILTDGCLYGGWGDWNVPTLWAITSKGIYSPVGKSLYLEV